MIICHKGDIAAGGGKTIVVCPHFVQGHIAADSVSCDVLTDVAILQFNGSRYIVECQFSSGKLCSHDRNTAAGGRKFCVCTNFTARYCNIACDSFC